jgi:flagellar assembly factor FliW
VSTALTFVESPPGLAPLVEFDLDIVDGAPGLYTLRAETGLRLFLVDAPVYVPWYEPEIDSESLASVGSGEDSPADLMVVATISDGAPIVNLMAPMIVNRRTGAAAQVILGDEWPLRAELKRPGAA